jgi:endonuclease YncB( thermonuclease family)
MSTGYINTTVAEARQRLQDLLRGIDNVIKVQKQAKENEQYNTDASALYVAARQDLLALAKDFDIFKVFIEDNKSKLYDHEPEYYAYKIDNIKMQLDYLEDTIIIPSLTAPISSGSTENDTDVGRSFEGKIVLVADGDTLTVEQVAMEGAIPTRHQVRVAGIDCPEGGTSRGKMVMEATNDFWLGRDVTVFYDRHTPNDLYGRVLGTVYSGDVNFALWSLERCYTEPNLKFGKNHFVDPVEFKQAAAKCISSWPQLGSIKVTSSPTHATVYVGRVGEDLVINDNITPCEIEMPVGRYVIVVSAPGYSSVRDEVDITNSKRQLPVYTLQKVPVSLGTVHITVAPIGRRAIISLDDSIVGIAPITVDLPVDVSTKISAVVDGGDYVIDDEIVVPVAGEIKRVPLVPRLS